MDALYGQTCSRCGGIHSVQASVGSIDLSGLLDKAIAKVYKDKAEQVKKQLSQAYGATYAGAVMQGADKNTIMDVQWGSPDWDMIKHLQTNVYHFSYAKTHEQLKALTAALYDKDGKIVPKKEFIEIAKRINNEFSTAHLATERDTAIAGAQMASRWVQFQNEKDDLPNLTYQTVGDERVRESHAKLDGVTRPVDDAFWDNYYPPNGWNCRCDVIQAIGKRVTAKTAIQAPDDVPAMFKTNLAKTGVVFPKDHPFFEHLPSDITKAADGANPFSYSKVHSGKNGGYVYDNEMRRPIPSEMTTGKLLADKGEKVILLPEIPADTEWQRELRKLVLPGDLADKRANPDALVNGDIWEFKKSTGSYSSFNRSLRSGQSDNVCIYLSNRLDEKIIRKWVAARLKAGTKLQNVWVVNGRKLLKYSADKLK